MPPKPIPAPPAKATASINWIQPCGETDKKSAGDPGIVLAWRLSNAEYNYTIRDLTGRDLQITRQFPVDPANPAGFDNSGESLTMSPALLNKYMQAAHEVADHMVLSPDAIDFAPHPMVAETDRGGMRSSALSASTPGSPRTMRITLRRPGGSGIEPRSGNRKPR